MCSCATIYAKPTRDVGTKHNCLMNSAFLETLISHHYTKPNWLFNHVKNRPYPLTHILISDDIKLRGRLFRVKVRNS